MVGRQSYSHLNVIGKTEFIAKGFDDYVDIAVSLAHDLDALSGIRITLRQHMEASPLCDGRLFANAFCDLMRETWISFAQKEVATK